LAQNIYEGMFLMDCGKVSRDWEKVEQIVHGILERHGAEVIVSRPWDERQLAYPIKRQRRGMYFLTYFRADGSKIADIERECRINESILRQLILKVHPKLADQLVEQARMPQEAAEQEEFEPAAYADAVEADEELIEEEEEVEEYEDQEA